jgi:hypothetical protein
MEPRSRSNLAQVSPNDLKVCREIFQSRNFNRTKFAALCAILVTPLNCCIFGLHNWDTERREASLIPQMETGTCRVAHSPLPHTPEFRLSAVGSVAAS